MRSWMLMLIVLLCGCPKGTTDGPPAKGTPTPVPVWSQSISVCSDGVHLCPEGEGPAWLRGYSDYGAFSLPYDYEKWMDVLFAHRIRLLREWACPFDLTWGGEQPFSFKNGHPILNETFFQNADRFLNEAARRRMFVLVDLTDHYNVQNKNFVNNPLNKTHGGPLTRGLPDMYSSPEILEMVSLTVHRLKDHRNLIFECANEPSGYSSIEQINNFHKNIVQVVRSVHGPSDYRLVAVNPVPDSKGRPTVPLPQEVGADLVFLHGASIENPKDVGTCTAAAISKRLNFLQALLKVPIVNDDDGTHDRKNPCNRYDLNVLEALVQGSLGVAGYNHKGQEPHSSPIPDVSEKELQLLKDAVH